MEWLLIILIGYGRYSIQIPMQDKIMCEQAAVKIISSAPKVRREAICVQVSGKLTILDDDQ